MPITLRPLTQDDVDAFRAMRLAALRETPGNYSGTVEQALARSDADWLDLLSGEGKCVFGLFDGEQLVGITGVFIRRDDPTGQTASYGMSHIAPSHRGKGLARLLYQARLDWALDQPQLKRITVCTRAGNIASRKGMERAGFTRTCTSLTDWPDGTQDEEWGYELLLEPLRKARDQKPG